jgi:hypothetical protein
MTNIFIYGNQGGGFLGGPGGNPSECIDMGQPSNNITDPQAASNNISNNPIDRKYALPVTI